MKNKILIILMVITLSSLSQTNKNDSLLSVVNNPDVNDTNKVKALNQLGLNHYLQADLERSQRYLTEALVKSEKISYKRGSAISNALLGSVMMAQNNNAMALKYNFKSLEVYRSINDTTCLNYLNNLNNVATVYKQLGIYNKSLEYYLRALNICEKKNKNDIIIFLNNNIASIYNTKSEYDKAITYYTTAFNMAKKSEDTLSNYPNIFFGFGDIYFSKKELDKSLSYYKRFLNIGEAIGDSSYMCSANIGIADVYKSQNKFDTSIKYLNQSLLFKDDERNATAYLSLGEIYMAQKKYKLSEISLNKSLLLGKKIQFKKIVCDTYKNLYRLDSCTNNCTNAIEHHKLYIAYRDSMYNLDSEKKMVATELNYNFDKEKSLIKFQQEEKNKRNNVIITGVVILLLLLTIISFIIYKSYVAKNKAHKLISYQKHLVDEKQKEILDNITYAKRIQSSIIPTDEYITKYAKNNFVFYKPKDIVSGDFYWATDVNGKFYLATADCTGHGVSGSMMSMLNISSLNENVNHRGIIDTGEILNETRKDIIKALNPKGNEGVNDGMDCVLCAFDFDNKTLQYSAANNSFYIIRNNKVIVCKADKMPIGLGMKNDSFKTTDIQLHDGDIVYMFTDGFPDQFGGENNKKFNYKRFEELLLSICDRTMEEQKKVLSTTFDYWKGHYEQTDDVLVIGVKIS